MKTQLFTLCAISFLFATSEIRGAEPIPAKVEHPVTKTLNIKAPAKISAVFWSVTRDLCTIQVSFLPVRDGQVRPEHPRTQVWLLKADGTVIPQTYKPSTDGVSMANSTTYSTMYVFPALAKTEATAAVVSIDNDFFVERLLPEPK